MLYYDLVSSYVALHAWLLVKWSYIEFMSPGEWLKGSQQLHQRRWLLVAGVARSDGDGVLQVYSVSTRSGTRGQRDTEAEEIHKIRYIPLYPPPA